MSRRSSEVLVTLGIAIFWSGINKYQGAPGGVAGAVSEVGFSGYAV